LPKLLRILYGANVKTIGFDEDHLHVMMSIPPKYSISSVTDKLKSQSAARIYKAFAWLTKVH
jgi:putative transposase